MNEVDKPQINILSFDDALIDVRSKKCKFVESIDVVINLSPGGKTDKDGIAVRGSVKAPFPLKKKLVIAVFCDDNISNADYSGGEELIMRIKNQPKIAKKIDVCVAHPKYLPKVSSQLGKILGKKRIMPDLRFGTVSENVQSVVDNHRFGVINFRANKNIIHTSIGNISLTNEELKENFNTLLSAVKAIIPNAVFASTHICSTMGKSRRVRC